jgi:hypothetical protein
MHSFNDVKCFNLCAVQKYLVLRSCSVCDYILLLRFTHERFMFILKISAEIYTISITKSIISHLPLVEAGSLNIFFLLKCSENRQFCFLLHEEPKILYYIY